MSVPILVVEGVWTANEHVDLEVGPQAVIKYSTYSNIISHMFTDVFFLLHRIYMPGYVGKSLLKTLNIWHLLLFQTNAVLPVLILELGFYMLAALLKSCGVVLPIIPSQARTTWR